MKSSQRPLFLLAAAALLLAAARAGAADEVPTFRKRGDMEKAFVAKVGTAVVKAARVPGKVTYLEHKYTTKGDVTTLKIKMKYLGKVSKKTYHSDITLKINSKDDDNWKVTDIDYKDDTKSVRKPNLKKVKELIREFNR
jgi:hypothetical protein